MTKENERMEGPISGDPCAVSRKVSSERAKVKIKTPSTRRYITQEKFKGWCSTQKKKHKDIWDIGWGIINLAWMFVVLYLYVLGANTIGGNGPDNPSLFYRVLSILGCLLVWATGLFCGVIVLFSFGFHLVNALVGLWNWITGKKKIDPDKVWRDELRHAQKKSLKDTSKETEEETQKRGKVEVRHGEIQKP